MDQAKGMKSTQHTCSSNISTQSTRRTQPLTPPLSFPSLLLRPLHRHKHSLRLSISSRDPIKGLLLRSTTVILDSSIYNVHSTSSTSARQLTPDIEPFLHLTLLPTHAGSDLLDKSGRWQ